MKKLLLPIVIVITAMATHGLEAAFGSEHAAPRGQLLTLTEPPVTTAFWAGVARRHDWTVQMGPDGSVVASKLIAETAQGVTFDRWNYPNHDSGHQPENPTIKPTLLVYIPRGYVNDRTWGLLVLDTYADKFGIPNGWKAICRKRQLVLAVLQDAGNDHHYFWREALIAKAYIRLHEKYKFNPQRIYLVGFSGGSRMASESTVIFSDIYKGEISDCCVQYPVLHLPAAPSGYAAFTVQPRYLNLARRKNRFFLFTGTLDTGCQQDTINAYHQYKAMNFRYVTLVDQPGAHHAEMSLANFQKGLNFLDAPLIAAQHVPQKIQAINEWIKTKTLGQAMALAHREMNVAPGMATCQQVKAIFNTLLPAYTQMRDQIETLAKKGNSAAFSDAIASFARLYLPYAQADIQELQREAAKNRNAVH